MHPLLLRVRHEQHMRRALLAQRSMFAVVVNPEVSGEGYRLNPPGNGHFLSLRRGEFIETDADEGVEDEVAPGGASDG